MKRSITIPLDGAVLDQIRTAQSAAGLQPMSDDQVAAMAANLGLRDILGNYTRLAEIERAARRPTEPMVEASDWAGALGARQAAL